MTIYAFKDDKDGYYQVDLADGEPFPEWTFSLTPCDVLPEPEPVPPEELSPVDKLKEFLAANPDVAAILKD